MNQSYCDQGVRAVGEDQMSLATYLGFYPGMRGRNPQRGVGAGSKAKWRGAVGACF